MKPVPVTENTLEVDVDAISDIMDQNVNMSMSVLMMKIVVCKGNVSIYMEHLYQNVNVTVISVGLALIAARVSTFHTLFIALIVMNGIV